MASATAVSASGSAYAYSRKVVAASACPSRAWAWRIWPRSTRNVATLCRSRCSVAPSTPARRARRANRWPRAPVVNRARWSKTGLNSHGPNSAPGRVVGRQSCSSWCQNIAVGCPDRECSVSSRLRRSDHVGRCCAGDVKDTVAEVVELECCKLSASRATVCCETHEQEVLLGEMPVLTIARTSNVVCNGLEQLSFGCCEESAKRFGFERPPRFGACRSAHGPYRMCVDDAFVVCPSNSGAQGAEPSGDDGGASASVGPADERHPHDSWGERRDAR